MAVHVYDTALREKTVIFALGMDNDKNTELLGWVVTDGEDEVSVRSLLINLKQRGLKKPDLFISDGALGIESALKLEYPHTERQLCCFHKIKNIQQHLTDMNNRKYILREAGYNGLENLDHLRRCKNVV
jgi:transposase-like protein